MKLNAGVLRRYSERFVVDESRLRKLEEILRTHGAKLDIETHVEFSISRSDDSFFETAAIDDVLQEDNSIKKAIRELDLMLLTPKKRGGDDDSNQVIARVVFNVSGETGISSRVRTTRTSRRWSSGSLGSRCS